MGGGRTLGRSVRLLFAFRDERRDPDRFYRLVSEDATCLLAEQVPLAGAFVVDVGGGAGYLTTALRAAGARCCLVDADLAELSWRGPPPRGALLADGRCLPFRSGSADVLVLCNVLEHAREPFELVDEAARVVRPGGAVWISFTNWFGLNGGHETSPWHYLGGGVALRRYTARTGRSPKNRYGETLFPVHVGSALRFLRRHPLLEVVDARPRYLPEVAKRLVRVPILRELLTWNLEVLAVRRRA